MADLNQQLAAIPFGALIGGPLNAAVEAQAKASVRNYMWTEVKDPEGKKTWRAITSE